MLVLAAVGIAVVVVIVTGKVVLVVAVTMSMFGADFVNGRGSIEMVDWRKVRVGVQRMRRMCQRYSWRP